MSIEEIRKRHDDCDLTVCSWTFLPAVDAHQDRGVLLERIVELERRLDAVAELPSKWRSQEWLSIPHEESKRLCAGELEVALSGKVVSDD